MAAAGYVDSVRLRYKDRMSVMGRKLSILAQNSAAVLDREDSSSFYPFGGKFKAGFLSMRGADTSVIVIARSDNTFTVKPKESNPEVPVLALKSSTGGIFIKGPVNRLAVSGLELSADAAMNSIERKRKAREFMDSLYRAYPDIPRDSLFHYLRRTRPAREIPDWLSEEDFRKNDIRLDVGENIRKYFREWDMEGSLSFRRTGLISPYFPLRNTVSDFKGSFDNNSIRIENITVKSGRSNLSANGSLTGLRGMILRNGFLNLDVDVTSDSLDLNQLLAAYSAGMTFDTGDFSGKDLTGMEDGEFEEMILKLKNGAYEILSDYEYRGPTHLSIGQEATAAGVCSALNITDEITSTHRGHGDSIAKGFHAIKRMTEAQLKARCPEFSALSGDALLEAVLEDHIFRTIAELFGKEAGYGKGRGGGMHIADFRVGHLGANAIVGGGIPIATGAAMTNRIDIDPSHKGKVVCAFAGDGAYANGVVLESFNWACQGQFTDPALSSINFGLPIIYCLINNHFGMTGRADREVTGVNPLVRRAAGFSNENMHAEVVNGMDPLAVRDAIERAKKTIAEGKGPVMLEFNTYRYFGHSLSDPRTEYRTKDEEAQWKEVDPVPCFRQKLIENGIFTEEELAGMEANVVERNKKAARRAADSDDPKPEDVIKYMYTDTSSDTVPAPYNQLMKRGDRPVIKRDAESRITYKDAIKEGMIEEMERDARVVLYGEDVAGRAGLYIRVPEVSGLRGRAD